MLQVLIEGKRVQCLVDTGETYTCLQPQDAQHLPRSRGKFLKTVGFSGEVQLSPITHPVSIRIEDKEVKIPILIAENTPINLLGRDALCKLHLQIECSPAGISIPGLIRQMSLMTAENRTRRLRRQAYWIGQLEPDVEKIMKTLENLLGRKLHKSLRKPRCPPHCTLKFDKKPDKEKEEEWYVEMGVETRYPLEIHGVIIAAEGIAADVRFTDGAHGVKLMQQFEMPGTVPHITLRVGQGFRARDMGPVMLRARQGRWITVEERNGYRLEKIGEEKVTLYKLTGPEFPSIHWGVPQVAEIEETGDEGKLEVPYVKNCPFGNPYCIHGLFGGSGYRCWNKDDHQPFDESDPDWERYANRVHIIKEKGSHEDLKKVVRCPVLCPYGRDGCEWCSLDPAELGPRSQSLKTEGHRHEFPPLVCAICQRECCPECRGRPCEKKSVGKPSGVMMIQEESSHEETKIDRLLARVPEEVWSQGEGDIGLVKSVMPVEFKLKPGAVLPFQRQYPLSTEATEGIRGTIEELLKAGVLEETDQAYCNTPIFPVLKADGVRWRMVQDLRPINAIIEDYPADVPHANVLLTNIPADAKVFSVIDLVQAFFSIRVAPGSRDLFAV